MEKHIAVLWNIQASLYSEIAKKINLYWSFKYGFILDLNNHLEEFVLDIYSNNKEKISVKLQSILKRQSSTVCVLYFVGSKYYDSIFMKNTIRNTFSSLVSDYLYDNLIHISDDNNEYLSNNTVVHKYINFSMD